MKRILLGLAILLTIIVISAALTMGWAGLVVIIPIVVVQVVLGVFLLIYFVLAPKNIFFTFIEEGTVKLIMKGATTEVRETEDGKVFILTKGGEAYDFLIQWTGYTLSKQKGTNSAGEEVDEWDVIEDGTMVNGVPQKEPKHLFGGLRFIGIYPLFRIYTYLFQWSGVSENGEVQHHPREPLDYINVKEDVFWAGVKDAEDKELLPLTIEALLTIRVINPKKALLDIQNWLEALINRTVPAIRDSGTTSTYAKLISRSEAIGIRIYKRLEKRGLIDEFRIVYGALLRKTEIMRVDPSPEYRKETLRKWLGERSSDERAAKLTGAVVKMTAQATGMTSEAIQQQLEHDPNGFVDKYTDVWNRSWDILIRQIAIDGGAYADIRTQAQEPGKTLLDLAAFWKNPPGVKPVGEEKKRSETKKYPFRETENSF